jgi:uncharacterized protein YggE
VSRSHRTRSLALVTLVVALVIALAVSLRGGSGGPDSAFAAATPAPGDAITPAQRTLEFTGSGDVQMQPDTAVVNVSVHGSGDTSDAAQGVASDKMNAVLGALRSLDSVKLSDSDLVTEGVNTSPDWEHKGSFISDQSLAVTLHDPTQSSAVIAAATAAGADSVNGPSFSLEDQSAAYRDALRSAIADARSKADAAAEAMGVKILGTTTVSENGQSGGPIMYAAADVASAKSAATPPPVQIGPVDVSAQVTVTFVYAPPAGP